jgi:hypothetical protein
MGDDGPPQFIFQIAAKLLEDLVMPHRTMCAA